MVTKSCTTCTTFLARGYVHYWKRRRKDYLLSQFNFLNSLLRKNT